MVEAIPSSPVVTAFWEGGGGLAEAKKPIFDISAQEGEGGFELVTSASLSVVPAD
jgi:hypothetical protein